MISVKTHRRRDDVEGKRTLGYRNPGGFSNKEDNSLRKIYFVFSEFELAVTRQTTARPAHAAPARATCRHFNVNERFYSSAPAIGGSGSRRDTPAVRGRRGGGGAGGASYRDSTGRSARMAPVTDARYPLDWTSHSQCA
ncbi:hypothetical protein EVAR_32662_1 [Eumeta japonica]|uniref:Uncharacterized protein n=1 Tax=Eumeta variegata TaxID=151549 RepID=A0A4C1WW68_EUMVA|nr:hypothetical protein EVAR_32662_1 [Eumeta japonica]